MSNDVLVANLADTARKAARTLVAASFEERKSALLDIATALESSVEEIVAANNQDMERGKAAGLNSQLLDRLMLNEARIRAIAGGTRKVAALPNPLGNVLRKRTLDNGLELTQVTVPFGVVGMVYEARPNVTVDAAVILIMSGNATLLRGSSSAEKSNEVLVSVIRRALSTSDRKSTRLNSSHSSVSRMPSSA